MSNRELEIIMRLKDEVSKKLQGVEGAMIKFANRMRDIGGTMKQLGRDISQVGQTIAFLGAAITGPLLLAFKNAEKYSNAVHDQMERLRNVTNLFQAQVAVALIPIMEKLTNILGAALQIWNSLSPATQQMIVQSAFVSGVFLSLSGIIIALTGRLIRLGGVIVQIAGKFMLFALANPYIAVSIALIAALIVLMFKFKAVSDTVLSTIEVLFLSFNNGLEAIRLGLSKTIAFILGMLEKIYNALSILPGALGKAGKEMATDLKKMREEVDKFGNQGLSNLERNTGKIVKIFSSGEGSLSEGFDNFKVKIGNAWDLLKNPPKINIKPLQESFDYIKHITDNTFAAVERTISDTLYNSITEKSFKLVDFFRQLGGSILRIWTDVLAKMITRWIEAQTTMQRAGGSSSMPGWLSILGKVAGLAGGFLGLSGSTITGGVGGTNTGMQMTPNGMAPTWSPYHRGGPVVRAHTGIGPNEIRAILRTGEGVVNPTGMGTLGNDNLNRLNSGKSIGGSIVLQPTVVIQAIDTRSGTEFLLKNGNAVGQALVQQILKNNVAVRGALSKYGGK